MRFGDVDGARLVLLTVPLLRGPRGCRPEAAPAGLCRRRAGGAAHHPALTLGESAFRHVLTLRFNLKVLILPKRRGTPENGLPTRCLASVSRAQVGAHVLEAVVRKFDDVYESGSEGKECDNLFTIIAHLYNFHVVQSLLVFDILKKLIGTFTEKDIELILLMLKNVGFSLRKDDALSLKELISEAQAKASGAGSQFQDQTRVRTRHATCFLSVWTLTS